MRLDQRFDLGIAPLPSKVDGVDPGAFRIDLGAPWMNDLVSLVLLALAAFTASLTDRFVETPLRDAFNRLSRAIDANAQAASVRT